MNIRRRPSTTLFPRSGREISTNSQNYAPVSLRQWQILFLSFSLAVITTTLRVTAVMHMEDLAMLQKEDHLGSPNNNGNDDAIHLVHPEDSIYIQNPNDWDSSPIVIEEYKLIFFGAPKVVGIRFKQLFRRIMGKRDWQSTDGKKLLPHNPKYNGLKYLWNFTLEEATEMMTSPEYTRAIIVQEPKTKFISAFLGKGVSNLDAYVRNKCCRLAGTQNDCGNLKTMQGFWDLIQTCGDVYWEPQSKRMESKYWPYINFVGYLEHLDEDGPALLKRIGALELYGTTGWGKSGTAGMFDNDVSTVTSSYMVPTATVEEWLTPSLSHKLEHYYADDYSNPVFRFDKTSVSNNYTWINRGDIIFRQDLWDGAPIVIEKYKLIFFTIPRNGDTTWKKAFRRMEGFRDWNVEGGNKMLPWDPSKNGLRYLYDYEPTTAEQLIKDPTWTKAVFVRNPKDRFLDVHAFLQNEPRHAKNRCCQAGDQRCSLKIGKLQHFLDVVSWCRTDLWDPQSQRMEQKYWEYINFVGNIESVGDDSKRLLEKIGAWEEIGATGWGENGMDRIFHSNDDLLAVLQSEIHHYTPEVDRALNYFYKADYENALFSFAKMPTIMQSR